MITATPTMSLEECKELELKSLLKALNFSYDKMEEIIKEVEAEKEAEALRKKEKEELSKAREKLIDMMIEYSFVLSKGTLEITEADREELIKMLLLAEKEITSSDWYKHNDFFKSPKKPAATVIKKEVKNPKEMSEAEDTPDAFLTALFGERK